MRRTASTALLVCVLGALGGCGALPDRIDLMPAPAVFDETNFDPLADIERFDDAPYSGMLYITDREPADTDGDAAYYSNQRSPTLRAGIGRVSYDGKVKSYEELRRITLAKDRSETFRLHVPEVEELGILHEALPLGRLTDPTFLEGAPPADEALAELIDAKLAMSRLKDVYIYVHGYRVVFENPLLVATELWHYMGYEGVFLAYAWPSTPQALAYFKDLETARIAGRNLRLLIEYLSRDTDVERIHLIGYSVGTRVVLTALHQLALKQVDADGTDPVRVGQVALVGSDHDLAEFVSALDDGMLNVADRITVYMSETDLALGMSRFVFENPRLGEMVDTSNATATAREFIGSSDALYFVNVTKAERSGSGNGHAYFRNSPWASSDLLVSLQTGMTPTERGLVREPGELIYSFPPDYIERLRAAMLSSGWGATPRAGR